MKVLLLAAALVFAAPAHAIDLVSADSAARQRVPYRMDASNQSSWWKPLAVRGRRLYVAFNGPRRNPRAHTVWVARHSPRSGRWHRACLRMPRKRRCVVYRDDPGHNAPTIAVDGDGYIHVFAGMHHNRWRYFRSRHPGRIGTMRFRSWQLWPRKGWTYPVTTTAPNGDVWLIVRRTKVDPFRTLGRMYHWSVRGRRWYSHGAFANAEGHGVYPADIVASPDGRIHIVWAWSGGPAGATKHAGSYAIYDPLTRTYTNVAGEPVAAPMTPDSPVLYQPIEDGELWTHVMDGYGELGADLALDTETGWPTIAYRYQAPADGSTLPLVMGAEVRIAKWNGSEWERQDVYEGPTRPGLGITVRNGETSVYYDGAGTVYRGGSLAVLRVGSVDYVYRADSAKRKLYYGIKRH